MTIARVFPRKTKATPDDALAFTGPPPKGIDGIDEVHISVAFSYDLPKAESLAEAWHKTGVPVRMGGPALGQPGGDFVPGMYLKQGYVITSRGCNNKCWFCSAWRREGPLRELAVTDGHIIQDDNLLACSESHIRAVFDMLMRQREKPMFTGGLEARLLKAWHVDLFQKSKTHRMYFAYDTPDDYEPLVAAGKTLRAGNITDIRKTACYVLIGYQGDTFEAAEQRLVAAINAGFWPFSMLYKSENGETNTDWRQFHRQWCNPWIVGTTIKKMC